MGVGGLFELGSQLLSGEEINWAKVGVATVIGGITSAVGAVGGAIISGASNAILEAKSGEDDLKKIVVSAIVGTGTSLIGSGVGKAIEKVGSKMAIKTLSKMSKRSLKATVTKLKPTITGVERNNNKSISYLVSNHPDIGYKYFESTWFGKTIAPSLSSIAEGISSIGINYLKGRFYPQ